MLCYQRALGPRPRHACPQTLEPRGAAARRAARLLSLRLASSLSLAALLAAPLRAQNGDHEGEPQPPLPADLEIPPAPVLTPEEQLESFALAPGFVIELVAAEPLVHDPVQISFDEDGRLWVVEMRGYMPDADGVGEREPVGSIAVLEDTDGDGRMDERRVFVDGLVLPRALAVARGGALVIAPPRLVHYTDEDGDGRADHELVVDSGLGGIESPEHAINGLLPTLDNYFQCANQGLRYRWRASEDEREGPGAWQRSLTGGGGQWGITKDDLGRIFFDNNSDPLRGDCLPSQYLIRNPNLGRAPGGNVRIVQDFTVWPARMNPGVNRGYQEPTLRDDFTLARFTGACAPHIYRGQCFPADFHGDAFVCEPCGNLVKRYRLREDGNGRLIGENAYEGREFLTSTHERFRPVQLADGPDGALYVVDLYRGLIQHRIFLTSFLRAQVDARGLAQPTGLGRIWRVRAVDAEPGAPPRLGQASWTELAGTLEHPGGWWRDTAQRLIVEDGLEDPDAIELVREVALHSESPLARVHALWSLEGIDGLNVALLQRALADPDARVRMAAVRLCEPWLVADPNPLLEGVVRAGQEASWAPLRNMVLLSLGEAHTRPADRALADFLRVDCEHEDRRGAVLSGLERREYEFVQALLSDEQWSASTPGRQRLVRELAACVAREGRGDQLAALIARCEERASECEWQALALLDGLLSARPKRPDGKPGRFQLPGASPAAVALLASASEALVERAGRLDAALAWPGRAGLEPEFQVRPLSADEQESFARGARIYANLCAGCHQPSGRGDPGQAPPLRGSEFVLGSERRLGTILLRGLVGPLDIAGGSWDMEMPAFVAGDGEIADVLTYVRREWGHGVEPITAQTIAALRVLAHQAGGPLTTEELAHFEE